MSKRCSTKCSAHIYVPCAGWLWVVWCAVHVCVGAWWSGGARRPFTACIFLVPYSPFSRRHAFSDSTAPTTHRRNWKEAGGNSHRRSPDADYSIAQGAGRVNAWALVTAPQFSARDSWAHDCFLPSAVPQFLAQRCFRQHHTPHTLLSRACSTRLACYFAKVPFSLDRVFPLG